MQTEPDIPPRRLISSSSGILSKEIGLGQQLTFKNKFAESNEAASAFRHFK